MSKDISRIKVKIAFILYSCLFVLLISSELLNSFFNNRFDREGITFLNRILISFKPSVLLLYVVFSTILLFLVLRYLKPLFNYFIKTFNNNKEKENAYTSARKAVIGMPVTVILFQIGVWLIGTTAYYAMKGWEAESGIPYLPGLIVKVSSGIQGALYVVFFINLIILPLKTRLKITNIRLGERDNFAIKKDYIAVLGASFYLFSQFFYIGWYFSQRPGPLSLKTYVLQVFPLGLFLIIMGIIPIFLSKKEFKIQVKTILKELEQLKSQAENKLVEPIYLSNFDYLGDLAAATNHVVDTFKVVLKQVNSTVSILSNTLENLQGTSETNAAATSNQAASVSEVVATMEDSDKLSKHVGMVANEVDSLAQENLTKVNQGIDTLKQYLSIMEQLKESNTRAIEFVFSLNENIKTIIDVSTIIKSIADQVKIIAFNAELEASAAGDAGKNFEIVASEVRRLADNTVNAAIEIRAKINFIEKESKNLYDASQNTTQLIDHGWKLSRETESSFQGIQLTSNETSKSAASIGENIQHQINGFEQILITMKDISTNSRDVSEQTQTTVKNIKTIEEIIKSLKELSQPK